MDLLYVVGDRTAWEHNELRYSLRSVHENLHHDKLVISGHIPAFIKRSSITHIPGKDDQGDRVRNVLVKLRTALMSGKVGDRFALMCDDFYALKPNPDMTWRYVGYLSERPRPGDDWWSRMVRSTLDLCRFMGIDEPLDFGSHSPFVMDRVKAIEAANLCLTTKPHADPQTIYWAMHGGPILKADNSKSRRFVKPKGDFFSSSPGLEANPAFREWITQRFPNPSPYEK